MPHSPKKPPTRQQPRRTARTVAQLKLEETEDNDRENSDQEEFQEEEVWEAVKRTATKVSSGRAGTLKNQKQSIYSEFRKRSKDISWAGNEYIDQPFAKLQELRAHELSYATYFKDVKATIQTEESTIADLLSENLKIIDDVSTRRAECMDTASQMILDNPARRQRELALFSRNARKLIEGFKQNEKAASDASAYIRHFKDLLRA